MRIAWWVTSAFALIAVVASVRLSRRGSIPAAQAVAIATLVYVLVFTSLWGMKSHFIRYPGVEIPRPVNRIMLAFAGGLLAQLIIILDRFLRGTLPKNRVTPLYARGGLGMLAGLVGLLIVAIPFSGVEEVTDNLATLSGIVGGGLGASVLEFARSKLFGSDKNSI